MARDYVCLYHSYLDAIQALGDAERGRLLTAMLEYSLTGATGHLGGNERFIFPIVKAQIDRDKAKYEETCRRRSESGKLGGRPEKQDKAIAFSESKKSQGKGKGKGKGECKGEDEGENNNPPSDEGGSRAGRANTLQEQILSDFPGELGKAVGDWLAYKTEKRQGYKPTGLQSLLTQIRNAAQEHGDAAVVKVIRDSMAANYQGIVFDRLSRNEKPGKKTSAPESKFDAQPSKAEQERLKQLLEGMGG